MTNKSVAYTFERKLSSAELVATANALISLCDEHDPPFTITFGADPESRFPGSSLRNDRALIFLATDGTQGQRAPEDILISLAHEVGHLHDPPTEADKLIKDATPAYFLRLLEREETAWTWASTFLRRSQCWSTLEAAFERARSFALAQYRALVKP